MFKHRELLCDDCGETTGMKADQCPSCGSQELYVLTTDTFLPMWVTTVFGPVILVFAVLFTLITFGLLVFRIIEWAWEPIIGVAPGLGA